MSKRVFIISAHADDETLGMGGTILKHIANGDKVYWLVLTLPWSPKWDKDFIDRRVADIKKVANAYPFADYWIWNFRDNRMDEYPMDEYQTKMIDLMENIKPSIIYFPNPWDMNFEHRMVTQIVEFSTKPPYSPYVEKLIAYEIPSATEWSLKYYGQFAPNMWVDITEFIDRKLEIVSLYSTELKSFPHSRSKEYILSLAKVRGGEAFMEYAEAFCVLRERW